jgi:hypothetical protein
MHEFTHVLGICPDTLMHTDLLDFFLIHFHDSIWYLRNFYLSLSMRKKINHDPVKMRKPKYRIDDIVTVNFLGSMYECKVLELTKNKLHIDRWVYTVKILESGRVLSYVGVNQSEKFANII